MTVEPVSSAGAAHASLTGVSAQLAEARAQLRSAVPEGSWDAVLNEVQKMQSERSMPLLAALQAVYAKIASGWQPSRF